MQGRQLQAGRSKMAVVKSGGMQDGGGADLAGN